MGGKAGTVVKRGKSAVFGGLRFLYKPFFFSGYTMGYGQGERLEQVG